MTTTTMANGRPFYLVNELRLSVPEQAILFADGFTAIARLEPLRVEWLSPQWKVVSRTPISWAAPAIDAAEKAFYFARVKARPQDEPFAERVPFFNRTLVALPDGTVMLRRVPHLKDPVQRYDVVDRRGAVTRSVTVADNQRIIGFGPKSAYVVTTDGDGIQRIARHPWP